MLEILKSLVPIHYQLESKFFIAYLKLSLPKQIVTSTYELTIHSNGITLLNHLETLTTTTYYRWSHILALFHADYFLNNLNKQIKLDF